MCPGELQMQADVVPRGIEANIKRMPEGCSIVEEN